MARGRSAGNAIVGLIVLGILGWRIQHPIVLVVALTAVVALAVLLSTQRNCQLCGVALKRTVYTWQIEGVGSSRPVRRLPGGRMPALQGDRIRGHALPQPPRH